MMDYDRYYGKHCARYYGWLPAAKEFKERVAKQTIKYFTLCAEQAIDVFMLEYEGILTRDKRGRVQDIIICERHPDVAAEIRALVRPPIQEAILVGPLERILTFEDNEHTRGLSPDEDIRNRHIREMLRIKGLHQRLKNFFPFDIINFDTDGNLLNHGREANRLLYKAFERIFELQASISNFLLFVTMPISDIGTEFQSRFKSDFEANVSRYSEISQSLKRSLQSTHYNELEENKRIALSIAKSVIIPIARKNGWNGEHKGVYIYENKDLRRMLSSVIMLSKPSTEPGEDRYPLDIVRIIEQMPLVVSYAESLRSQEIKDHLQRIIEYRENIRNQYAL